MKNLLFLLLTTFALSGCENQPEKKDETINPIVYLKLTHIKYNFDIKYFKDTTTGLCFAEKGVGDQYSFTCVPCDSIYNHK